MVVKSCHKSETLRELLPFIHIIGGNAHSGHNRVASDSQSNCFVVHLNLSYVRHWKHVFSMCDLDQILTCLHLDRHTVYFIRVKHSSQCSHCLRC